MGHNNNWELFPDRWYSKMAIDEVEEARQSIRTYAASKELDTGLSDVSFLLLFGYCPKAMIAVI
jgi:hypothetical protein